MSQAISNDERLSQYEKLKSHGNEQYKKKDFKAAKDLYTQAIATKEDEPIAYSNRAACHLEIGDWYHAVVDCNSALEIDSKLAKAYFRRGTALRKLARFEPALKDFTKVIEIDGQNKRAAKEAQEIKEIIDKDPRVELIPMDKPKEFRCKKPMQRVQMNGIYSGVYKP